MRGLAECSSRHHDRGKTWDLHIERITPVSERKPAHDRAVGGVFQPRRQGVVTTPSTFRRVRRASYYALDCRGPPRPAAPRDPPATRTARPSRRVAEVIPRGARGPAVALHGIPTITTPMRLAHSLGGDGGARLVQSTITAKRAVRQRETRVEHPVVALQMGHTVLDADRHGRTHRPVAFRGETVNLHQIRGHPYVAQRVSATRAACTWRP